ncbi:MAG: tetraacyldisaccharide 4'-kinase, partial [bacterium]|nr:tetraacyldisaccharide 4'-kinase [bacterium]
ESWLDLKKNVHNGEIHLVLAPRHLEQVERIANLVRETGEPVELWTNIRDRGKIEPGVHAVVVNTIGELMKLYGAADIAFVGGSLIKRGGHNVLEPVAMGVPTLHGPSMDNFHDLKKVLGEADLITEVADSGEFTKAAERIFKEVDLADYRAKARLIIDNQLKAADMIADWVASKLPTDQSVPLVSLRKARKSKTVAEAFLKPIYSTYMNFSHSRVEDSIADAVKLPVPVISVGNIAFGGTAKTPTVKHIAANRAQLGFKPGIVMRGYKGTVERLSAPPAIVSDGDRIFLEWEDSGDEARLLAENLLSDHVPVAVGRDRIEASRMLIDKHGVDLIILDDGFQFTKLKRDFDLALIDALAPFGRSDGGFGLLREPASALERADAILLTRSEAVPEIRIEEIRQMLFHFVRKLPPIYIARTEVRGIKEGGNIEIGSPEVLRDKRVLGFSGIGNPFSFEKTVESLKCVLAGMITFPDHHPYSPRDIQRINSQAVELKADFLVTTRKDAVRLEGMEIEFSAPLYVVDIDLHIQGEEEFFGYISVKLKR